MLSGVFVKRFCCPSEAVVLVLRGSRHCRISWQLTEVDLIVMWSVDSYNVFNQVWQ
jgi:hypothetical protein